jgi:hypothetical protein
MRGRGASYAHACFKLTAEATASPWQGMDQARFGVSTSSPSLSAASTANNTPEKITDKSPAPVLALEFRQVMTSPGNERERQRLIYLMQKLKLLLQVLSVSVCDVTTVVLNEEAWILRLRIMTHCTSASFRH